MIVINTITLCSPLCSRCKAPVFSAFPAAGRAPDGTCCSANLRKERKGHLRSLGRYAAFLLGERIPFAPNSSRSLAQLCGEQQGWKQLGRAVDAGAGPALQDWLPPAGLPPSHWQTWCRDSLEGRCPEETSSPCSLPRSQLPTRLSSRLHVRCIFGGWFETALRYLQPSHPHL